MLLLFGRFIVIHKSFWQVKCLFTNERKKKKKKIIMDFAICCLWHFTCRLADLVNWASECDRLFVYLIDVRCMYAMYILYMYIMFWVDICIWKCVITSCFVGGFSFVFSNDGFTLFVWTFSLYFWLFAVFPSLLLNWFVRSTINECMGTE